jgi:carbonic anhydrase
MNPKTQIGPLKEMTTDSLSALLDRNLKFAESFESGHLTIRPRWPTVILTCVDARVDPTHFLGLELGEVRIMRNVGAKITPKVITDIGILGVLAANMPGGGNRQPELIVIHHEDCGMARLTDPDIQQQVAARLGISVDEVNAMASSDPAQTVQDEIERLRQMPGTPDHLVVSGFVYDVKTGTINEVVSPASLRATA